MAKFFVVLIWCLILTSQQAHAVDNIMLKVGYSPGGGYDTAARLVSRHMGRFLPGNPSITVQNVPGGGSLKLTKLMMSHEPADGSVIAMINAATGSATVLDPKNANFDANSINWIGSLGNQALYCYSGSNSQITTVEDFLSKPLKLGASGVTSQTYLFGALVKNLFNPQIDMIVGFEGGTEVDLAVERGELDGRCAISMPSLKTRGLFGNVRLVGFWALSNADEGGGGANFMAMIDNETDRKAARLIIAALQMYYPMIMPPSTSQELVDTYRSAFAAMVTDAAFLEDAKKLGLEIRPTGGAELAQNIKEQISVDQTIIDRARDLSK